MKDTFYFSHDYNARSDDKIRQLIRMTGMKGYGIYWAIIEDLYNNANALRTDYKGIAYDLRVPENLVKSIVNDFNLFTVNTDTFSSDSVQRRLNDRQDKSIKARESANKRWGLSDRNANALRPQSEGNAIKERKGKERKGNNNYNPFGLVRDEKYILNNLGWEKDIETYHGIQKKYPKLFMMTSPLTFDQHEALVKVWGTEQVKDIYSEMQNYTRLFLSNEEAAKTANNWIKRNKKKEALK